MLHASFNQNMDLGKRKSNQIKNCYKIVICTETHAVTKMADLTRRNIIDDEIICTVIVGEKSPKSSVPPKKLALTNSCLTFAKSLNK